ncbi:MAG: beta-N-acetylhexosaminidase [Lachnospiraceae bacterium]|nr:beta-N-acetylhexosaminidase [Lachnospiraceae bacterium]
MKYLFINASAEAKTCITELFRERKEEAAFSKEKGNEYGRTVVLKEAFQGEDRFSVSGSGKDLTLSYGSLPALCRGIGRVISLPEEAETADFSETLSFERLMPMIDCSRNAVIRPESLKCFIRMTALLGYNALMLYTEDTYEVEGEPYFGHLRGRYSKEEIRSINDYAKIFGIELIPCIQTLAHLNAIFQWPEYQDRKDWDDILDVTDERNYELIRHMIASVADCFSSRHIHIGMDEAYILGRGRTLDKAGYRPSSVIMKEHLEKVTAIVREYGFEPEIWSDMFFRMCTKSHTYYDPECVVTEEVRRSVPEDLTLVYWDYYGLDVKRYERMLCHHEELTDRISFAGGDSSWYGLVPLNRFSMNAARAALKALGRHHVKEVIVTMWGDDGGACSHFATLPTLVLYAEGAWGQVQTDRAVDVRMKTLFGAKLGAFLKVEALTDLPGRESFGRTRINPTKYMFYNDLLSGKFDCHVPDGSGAHFEAMRRSLRRRKNAGEFGEFGYISETFEAFSDVLSIKAELGKKIRAAYNLSKTEGRDVLLPIVKEDLKLLKKALKRFETIYEAQWMAENKPFGYDVMAFRFAAMESRIDYAERVLGEYIAGVREAIPELEEPVLPVMKPEPGDGILVRSPRWSRIATASVI